MNAAPDDKPDGDGTDGTRTTEGAVANSASSTPVPTPSEVKPAKAPAPPEVQEILSRLPEEQRGRIEQLFAMMVQGPMTNPMLAKVDGAHIHKVLDGVEADNKRSYEDRDKERTHKRTLALVCLAGFLLISGLFLWAGQAELLTKILIGFALFLGGLGAGARFIRPPDAD